METFDTFFRPIYDISKGLVVLCSSIVHWNGRFISRRLHSVRKVRDVWCVCLEVVFSPKLGGTFLELLAKNA
jgi:hypothetical protein